MKDLGDLEKYVLSSSVPTATGFYSSLGGVKQATQKALEKVTAFLVAPQKTVIKESKMLTPESFAAADFLESVHATLKKELADAQFIETSACVGSLLGASTATVACVPTMVKLCESGPAIMAYGGVPAALFVSVGVAPVMMLPAKYFPLLGGKIGRFVGTKIVASNKE